MVPRAISEAAIFRLGRLVATPQALYTLEQQGVTPFALLKRHASGDWGDVSAEDAMANQIALQSGSRLFSAYRIGDDSRIWVITESDRSCTTILLPAEY
ncbi:hypothetical protein [Noviherbaspirillum sp.]|uniref:hypothetical protein n=1 Tax=Noviherbaspirillum sp. TaxID=1926288 RepID=UPI002FDF32C4